MRYVMSIFLLALFVSVGSFAQSPSPSASPISMASPAPVATAVVAPATVTVPAATAPPAWVIDVLQAAEKFPVVGPILSKAMIYMGVAAVGLTALVAALLAILSALSSVASFSGLSGLQAKIVAFQNGPIMYWITYFSNFNAQQPVPIVTTTPTSSSGQAAA